MKIVNWIVQVVVAIVFLGTGMIKLITPYGELIMDPNAAWANDFTALQVKLIGGLEILGALGVILPMFLKKFKKLVPLAAVGLALVMVGAAVVHVGRGESIIPNVILFVLAGYTAWARKEYLKGTSTISQS